MEWLRGIRPEEYAAGSPEGFDWTERGGEVHITHRGQHATTLRGVAATEFRKGVERCDPRELRAPGDRQ